MDNDFSKLISELDAPVELDFSFLDADGAAQPTEPPKTCCIQTSGRHEMHRAFGEIAVHISKDLYLFYKSYFDGIKSFTKDDKDWKPYTSEAENEG